MEQHAVPQHIASFEFKLFGNLTVRQFVFLAIPLGFAALIFFSNLPAAFRFITSGIIAVVGAIVALLPYNGRSIDKWFLVFVKAVTSPTQRVWHKEIRIPEYLEIILNEPEVRKEPNEGEFTRQDREKLIEYLRQLPKGQVSPMDVRENLALDRLGLSYEGAAEGKLPAAIRWGTTKATKPSGGFVRGEAKEVPRNEAEIKLPRGVVSAKELRRTMGHSLPGLEAQSNVAGVGVRISPHMKHYALGGLEKRLHVQAKARVSVAPPAPAVQLASDSNFSVENVIPITTVSNHVKLVHGVPKSRARKLHFAPPPGFDLSDLPIRGEARFEISEELKRRYEREEEEKVQALNQQIAIEEQSKEKSESSGFEHMFSSAISQAKSIITGGGMKTQTQKVTIPKGVSTYQKPAVIAKHVTDIFPQASLKEEQKEKIDSRVSLSSDKVVGKPMDTDLLAKAQFLPLTDKPNVISGLVILVDESPLEGAIVIVRDTNGIPVRALKTNKLGQFLSMTPLPSGNYSLEVEGEEQIFEPVSIILTDKVIEPLMIKAKE